MLPLTLQLYIRVLTLFVFFFQAEDGIRDIGVTGVQTCALPICLGSDAAVALDHVVLVADRHDLRRQPPGGLRVGRLAVAPDGELLLIAARDLVRDRESVVEGKSVELGGRRIIKKKKKECYQ